MKTYQRDNGDLGAKLKLRKYFLEKYHVRTPPRVFDCCQGEGKIWSTLREEFQTAEYWGVDKKPKKGRLNIDSLRVLGQTGWEADVVDIDTYGSPWKHWVAMLPNIRGPLTVFLTVGQWLMGTDRAMLDALGVGSLNLPPGLAVKLHDTGINCLLAKAHDFSLELTEIQGCRSRFSHGRYIGVRIG